MNKTLNFEEFNLGRQKSFYSNFIDAKLFIVHDLEVAVLSETLAYLKESQIFQDVQTIYFKNIDSLQGVNRDKTLILTTHLNLDSEISSHQMISSWAFEQKLYQLNPYNKIAKLFDDKYMFYVLMKANDFKQANTQVLSKLHNSLDKLQLSSFNKLMIKPRCGTESRDSDSFETSDNTGQAELVEKILNYDDVLVQEYLETNNEFSVLFLDGKFFLQAPNDNPNLKQTLNEFLEMLDDYSRRNQVIMPHVFSLDILELTSGKLMILEANIRPAKIYSYKESFN